MSQLIDTSFDVRTDAGGKDPDSHSATLRGFHQLLWSKPLPRSVLFELDEQLHHESDLGTFSLASDAITHTYANRDRPPQLVVARDAMPAGEVDSFYDLGCTVGAYTVFPSQVWAEGKWRLSMNQARGIHPRIGDRFDLTLECIRRQYEGLDNPLAKSLRWHWSFFELFDDFPGYVNFFLLQDLVNPDDLSVRFLTDFDNFQRSPLPAAHPHEYREYRKRTMDFIRARNRRIDREFAESKAS